MILRKIFSAIAVTLLILSANVSAEPKALAFDEGVDWRTKIITVKGAGFAPEDVTSRTQAEGLAFTAAKSDAYRRFGEIVSGVRVEGDRTIAKLSTEEKIRTRVEATISGAKIVGQDLFSELTRGCAVYMQLPIFGVKDSLAEAVLEKPSTLEPFPTPEFEFDTANQSPLSRLPSNLQLKSLASEPLARKENSNPRTTKKSVKDYADKAEGTYTGLIVDCRGLGLQPVMSPVILNTNGTKIYGHKNLDFDKIVSQGMVDYARNSGDVSRAGENPLTVKAVRLENFNSSPVLSITDSNKVLIENHATKFLNDLKVVFLCD